MPDTGNLKDQVDEVAGTLFEPALNGVNLAECLRAILNTGTAPPKITSAIVASDCHGHHTLY